MGYSSSRVWWYKGYSGRRVIVVRFGSTRVTVVEGLQ